MNSKKNFEKLWERAQNEPQVKHIKAKKKVEVDLSLENILDLYVAHAREGARENRISQSVLDELTSHTEHLKARLEEIDSGARLRKFTKGIGSRIKRIF